MYTRLSGRLDLEMQLLEYIESFENAFNILDGLNLEICCGLDRLERQ